MKKIILSIFAIILGHASIAQNYQSYFGEVFTKWYSYHEISNAAFTYIFEVSSGDLTLINDKEYCIVSDGNYIVYMREEKDSGKLYFLNEFRNNGEEFVISDMSLEKGDTVRFPDIDYWGPFGYNLEQDETGYYTIVDSVYYENNRKHIQTELSHDFDLFPLKLTFVEGVGPSFGFFYFIENWGVLYALNCYETDSLFWKNKEFWSDYYGWINPNTGTDCLVGYASINDPKPKIDFTIEKQSGSINLLFEKPITAEIKLYDTLGRIVYSNAVSNNEKISISTIHFSPGTYILSIFDKNTITRHSEKINF